MDSVITEMERKQETQNKEAVLREKELETFNGFPDNITINGLPQAISRT
jgi:hypothetical protein